MITPAIKLDVAACVVARLPRPTPELFEEMARAAFRNNVEGEMFQDKEGNVLTKLQWNEVSEAVHQVMKEEARAMYIIMARRAGVTVEEVQEVLA